MKTKHIVALVLAVLFISIAGLSLVENKIDYADFKKAEGMGKRAQISGTWVKEKGAKYDAKSNTFSFHMKDKEGIEMPVKFSGMKPNNFELAPNVVCVGKIEEGVFHATDIQTKCPSKYEGSGGMNPNGNVAPAQTEEKAS